MKLTMSQTVARQLLAKLQRDQDPAVASVRADLETFFAPNPTRHLSVDELGVVMAAASDRLQLISGVMTSCAAREYEREHDLLTSGLAKLRLLREKQQERDRHDAMAVSGEGAGGNR